MPHTPEKDCCPRKGAPFAESDATGRETGLRAACGWFESQSSPSNGAVPGRPATLEVDSTHRRLPVASDPSTLTFHGENVPKGTGVMQSELRGELGEEADLSGATWPCSWTRPLGIRDAAVRLGGGEHGAL